MIRTLDGCSCDEGPVIILEDAIIGDVSIVYATDAKQRADKVDVCLTLTGHKPVTYPIAVATTGSDAAMGQAFVDFALSPEGQAILARYGFSKP